MARRRTKVARGQRAVVRSAEVSPLEIRVYLSVAK